MNIIRFFLVFFLMSFLFSCEKSSEEIDTNQIKTLSEIQSIWSQQSDIKKSVSLNEITSIEQKEIFGISDIFSTQAQQYEEYLYNVLTKYIHPLYEKDYISFQEILAQNSDPLIIQELLLRELGISMTLTEVNTLLSETHSYIEESQVAIERLENIESRYNITSNSQEIELIEKIIRESFGSKEEWTQIGKETLITHIISYFYNTSSSVDTQLIQTIINGVNYEHSTEIQIEQIIENTYSFDEVSFVDFLQNITQEYEVSLSYIEIIQDYIEYTEHTSISETTLSEIEMIESGETILSYESILSENTQQIESIYNTIEILESITTSQTQSYFESELNYDEIEVLSQQHILDDRQLPEIYENLLQAEYIDDSELIKDLDPIAYLQELSWTSVVTNLAGGALLAEEDMLLYSWYTLETYSQSDMTIIFSDESLLRLEENTKLILSGESTSNAGVNLQFGGIWARVIKPLFSNESFTIENDSVSLAVRGTSLYMSQDVSGVFQAYIVDSYQWDGSQSVELKNKSTGNMNSLSAGESYLQADDSETGTIQSKNRLSLMQENSDISIHITDDLKYLSLLLDDRKRGFYNNPLSHKNDSQDFLDKLSGEIDTTLPDTEEISELFQNLQTPTDDINSENIFIKLIQDNLISQISFENSENIQEKISAIASLELSLFDDEDKNFRSLQNKLDAGLWDDIVSDNTINSETIVETIENFNLDEAEQIRNKLLSVKSYIKSHINNGNPYVKSDFSLLQAYAGVEISWSVNDQDFLELNNDNSTYIAHIPSFPNESDEIVALSASLFYEGQTESLNLALIIQKQEPSDAEKLQDVYKVLKSHIRNTSIFTNSIPLPNFNNLDAIIPDVEWKDGDGYINSDGTINRPEYWQWDLINYTVQAIISFGEAEITKSFTLGTIKESPLWDEILQEQYGFSEAETTFPWCDTPDIQLSNGQVWAMCNAGSKKTGMSSDSYWNYFLYQYNEAINACKQPWYKTPSRNDWIQAQDSFDNIYSDTQNIMKLPKAWYEDLWMVDEWENVWNNWYFWTSEEKSSCTSNCWYAFSNGSIVRKTTDYHRLSVRCIKTDIEPEPTTSEIAEELLIENKQLLSEFFSSQKTVENTVTNITKISGFPSISGEITLQWSGTSYLNNNGVVTHPSYNSGDKNKVITLTLSHDDTSTSKIIQNIELKFKKQKCNGTSKIIDGVCYGLVASAEYNDNTNLVKTSGGTVTRNQSWVKIQTKSGQKWAFLEKDSNNYLSYNLSSLNLWDDWAIEMSVKGSDLKRTWLNNWLLSIPWSIYIYQYNGQLKKSDANWINWVLTNNLDWYQNIFLTKNGIFLNSNKILNVWLSSLSEIKVGSHKDDKQQWNWIINYLKILKKKD